MEPSITSIVFIFAGAFAAGAGWHLGSWITHVIVHPKRHFPGH